MQARAYKLLPGLLFDSGCFAEREEEVFRRASDRINGGATVVGGSCALTPKDLMAAPEAIPVSLCASAEKTIPDAEGHLLRNLCPLIKSRYGFALTDACPSISTNAGVRQFRLLTVNGQIPILMQSPEPPGSIAFEHDFIASDHSVLGNHSGRVLRQSLTRNPS